MVLAICVSVKTVLKKKDDFHMIFLWFFFYLVVIWRVSFKGTLNVARSYFVKTDPIV